MLSTASIFIVLNCQFGCDQYALLRLTKMTGNRFSSFDRGVHHGSCLADTRLGDQLDCILTLPQLVLPRSSVFFIWSLLTDSCSSLISMLLGHSRKKVAFNLSLFVKFFISLL